MLYSTPKENLVFLQKYCHYNFQRISHNHQLKLFDEFLQLISAVNQFFIFKLTTVLKISNTNMETETLKPIISSLSNEEISDKIKGVIYGAALGDAVGLAAEFMTADNAKQLYGVGPIQFGDAKGFSFWRDRHRQRWHENDFTDDTDQLLLILQCLLSTEGHLIPTHFAYRLQEWTKIGLPELSNKMACGVGFTVGSVLSHPDFLTDPHKAAFDVWNSKNRNLAANGAVMRTAVLGVPYFWDETVVVGNSMSAAKVTHADPRSVVSAVITSVVISKMLSGQGKDTEKTEANFTEEERKSIIKNLEAGSDDSKLFVQTKLDTENHYPQPQPKSIVSATSKRSFFGKKKNEISNWPQYPEPDKTRLSKPAKINQLSNKMDDFGDDIQLTQLCRHVADKYTFMIQSNSLCPSDDDEELQPTWTQQLNSHCYPPSLAALKLGEPQKIGYTLKCLGSGIYCLTRKMPTGMSTEKFFKDIITELTLQAGDSDTNCAVAGALLGCRLGKSGLPKDWLKGLKHTEYLDNVCNQLCQFVIQKKEMI